MRPRLVLDTNTVLALWMFHDPRLCILRDWIEAGACTLSTRADALRELQLVLAYRQFALDTLTQQRVLQDYRARVEISAADVVPDTRALPLCRDADDQKFLEIAFDTGASSLLTRDKALLRLGRHRLLRERFAILSPEHFVNQLPTL